jgi:hypothetical protein
VSFIIIIIIIIIIITFTGSTQYIYLTAITECFENGLTFWFSSLPLTLLLLPPPRTCPPHYLLCLISSTVLQSK